MSPSASQTYVRYNLTKDLYFLVTAVIVAIKYKLLLGQRWAETYVVLITSETTTKFRENNITETEKALDISIF